VKTILVNGWFMRRLPDGRWQWQTSSVYGDWAYLDEDMYAAAIRIRWTKR